MMKKNTKKPIYKRREILIGASALTAAGVLTACKDNVNGGTPDNPEQSTAISKNIIQWKMITCWPRDFPGGGTHSQKLAKRITEASDGRLELSLIHI